MRRFEASAANGLRRFAEVQRALYPGTFPALLEVGGGVALFAGVGSPLTQVAGLGLGGVISDEDLGRMEDFYTGRGSCARVDVTPLVEPDLSGRLTRRGYAVEARLGVWSRDLSSLDGTAGAVHWPIEVTEAVRREERELWATVVTAGFRDTDQLSEAGGESLALERVFSHMGNVRCFLACVGGTPAAGGGLAADGELATLFSASTLPNWRGHGLHRALIRGRLLAARAAGCTTARIEAKAESPSARNIERAGFTRAYEKVAYVKPLRPRLP